MKNIISIIIPVYNVEKYINQCLQSVINQSYKNLEIILIDDGSTDNSGRICDKYAKIDNRVRVVHEENSGVSVARNVGIDISTGSYIMFVDPDDWLELDACDKLLKKILKNNDDIVIFNFYRNYSNNDIPNKSIDYFLDKTELLQKSILAPSILKKEYGNFQFASYTCNKIINAKFLKKSKIKFQLENLKAIFEDGLFYYMLFDKTKNISIFNEYLYHYRIVDTSVMNSYNKDIPVINKFIYKSIKESSNYSINENALCIRMINNFSLYLNSYLFNKKNQITFKQKMNILNEALHSDEYVFPANNVKFKYLSLKLKIYAILMKFHMKYAILVNNKIEMFIKKILRK